MNISVWLLTDNRSHVKAKEKPWHSTRVLHIKSRLWCSKRCTPNIVPDGQKGNLMIGFVEVTTSVLVGPMKRHLQTFKDISRQYSELQATSRRLTTFQDTNI
jgi:hypothetical protein